MIRRLILLLLCSTHIHTQDTTFNTIRRGNRRVNAKTTRVTTANNQATQNLCPQQNNGDQELYADKRASYGKALKQLANGLIDVAAFNQMLTAFQLGCSNAFLDITMGTNPVERRLVDPQAAFAFGLEGADGWINSMPPAPTLTSAESAGEMVEVYWQAILRDVPFNEYDTNAQAAAAIADLNSLTNFKGPKVGGVVTPQTLFRSGLPGDTVGPYISQFLYLPVPTGPPNNFSSGPGGIPGIDFQAATVPTSSIANDFMTTVNVWKLIQMGNSPIATITYTDARIFIRDGRDMGEFVHFDFPQLSCTNAALILLNFGAAALDPNNPYLTNPTQEAFVTYAIPDIVNLISMAAESALRAAWYQKWMVHLRLRPEFYGFLIHQQKSGAANFGLNNQIINSPALTTVLGTFGTYLLPQAYPEGSPTHPAYPAGHATFVGACTTILKAFFNEDFVILASLEPNATNDMLIPFVGTPLTVGGECNKLAGNISLGRDHAGVHYRSDGIEGILLGEKIAIALLEDESFTRNVNFKGYHLTKFDGTKILVGGKKCAPMLN